MLSNFHVSNCLEAATSCLPSPESYCILAALKHMNLLKVIRKLFVECDSANSTWIAEIAVHTDITPQPSPCRPLFYCSLEYYGPKEVHRHYLKDKQGSTRWSGTGPILYSIDISSASVCILFISSKGVSPLSPNFSS
jgi:hypothetical protein